MRKKAPRPTLAQIRRADPPIEPALVLRDLDDLTLIGHSMGLGPFRLPGSFGLKPHAASLQRVLVGDPLAAGTVPQAPVPHAQATRCPALPP
jgi:hypothetical protein